MVADGQQFLRLKEFESPNHLTSPALQVHGESKSAMARFCRAVRWDCSDKGFSQRSRPTARSAMCSSWKASLPRRARMPSLTGTHEEHGGHCEADATGAGDDEHGDRELEGLCIRVGQFECHEGHVNAGRRSPTIAW